MITIEHVSKEYKGHVMALNDVNLDIPPGMFGLLGPNGAGKTTLMRIIAGLMQPTQGKVTVFGHDLGTAGGKQAAKSQLGYLPQDLGLYPNLNAYEFLDYIAILKGITNSALRRAQIEELLELTRLTQDAKRPLKTYSGGMKRRIGIAQALLGEPKLLIVDEPTVGLDPEERVRFRTLLSQMAARCTVILSTHIIEDINHSCRDLAIIHQGRVTFRGTPLELIEAARGNVWSIMTQGPAPDDMTITSTIPGNDGVLYRVLGKPDANWTAQPVAPTLEEGYVWLMRQNR